MSWAHVRRAIESELRGLDKLVLIMLANHTNDDAKHPKFGLAWPSVTTLAKETGVTRRSIHRILNRLESDGFLTRENHGTRSPHYRLRETQGPTNAFMGQGDTPSETQCPTASDTESHKPPRETPKEPEKKKPPSGGASAALRALGSEQSNPASSAHDCARAGQWWGKCARR